jgi:YebC/PmpR family DNA-binding regulatory protein
MSGHNKWSKIKHKKAASDSQKSKIFGKLGKLLATESKKVGGDVTSASLRTVIEKAKEANMPIDNINRAVQKGKTDTAAALEEIVYEAYGPGGVALVIVTLTDNRNRTAQEMKHLLNKNDLTLAAPGSALWAFSKKDAEYIPKDTIPLSETDTTKLETLMEALDEQEDVQEVFTNAG